MQSFFVLREAKGGTHAEDRDLESSSNGVFASCIWKTCFFLRKSCWSNIDCGELTGSFLAGVKTVGLGVTTAVLRSQVGFAGVWMLGVCGLLRHTVGLKSTHTCLFGL